MPNAADGCSSTSSKPIRIGIVGIGFMGMTHFEAARKLKGGKVTAIATRDPKKLAGDWTSIQGNFGPPGGNVNLSKIKKYADYRDLLRDPDVDLVDICLPVDQHETAVLEAIAAGKAVVVEKPIATKLKTADRMVNAAAKAGVPLMVAHVLPFVPEFKFVANCVQSGKYGKLRAAHFRRVISRPDWSADQANLEKSGGPGVDLHIHDNHFISLICGVPKSLQSRGILQQGFAEYVTTQYTFEDPEVVVSCVSGGISAPGLAFAHAFEVYFERATVIYEFNTLGGEPVVNRPLTLIEKGKVKVPKLPGSTNWCGAFTDELQVAIDGLRSGQTPRLLSGELARDALKLCECEVRSIATGKSVAVR